MNVSVLHRQRAERFAELLDQGSAPGSGQGPRHRLRSRADAELADLVALGQRTGDVRLTPNAGPEPGFRADLRAMLVATVEREGIRPAVAEPAKSSRRRLLAGPGGRARAAIIGGVAAGALVLSGIAAASGGAMPGDALYGVKRSTERAELAFAGSDAGRGQLYLEFARTRLAEAKSVSGSATGFRRSLDDMDSDTRQGVKLLTAAAVERKDPDTLDPVDTFVRAQQSDVGDVLDQVDGASRTRLLSSLDLLEKAATRTQQLRESLTCGVPTGGGSDDLGPRPGTCSPGSKPAPGTPGGQVRPSPSHGARGGTTEPTGRPGSASSTPPAMPSHPQGVGGTGKPTQGPTSSATPGGDGGLLGGLRRILGDLLGGGG